VASRIKAAARKTAQKKHSKTGRFVSHRPNGETKDVRIETPLGVSPMLTRILRPQAAFRWLLPPVAAITPQYLETVMRGALAGNHVQQWELFDLMFDTWPALNSCFAELTHAVTSKKLVFEPYCDEDDKPTPQAVERCTLVSTALRGMDPDADRDENTLHGTIVDLLDAWLRGITVLEVLWQTLEDDELGTIVAPRSTFWVHPVAYGFSQDGILGLRSVSPYQASGYANTTIGNQPVPQPYPASNLQAQPQPAVLTTFPDHKFLIAVHKAKSGTALAGPVLRPLAWWWLAANYSSDWLLNLAQLFGLPFRFATYDPQAPDETKQTIFNMLQNMGTAGWAAFPQGTSLEFKETGGGRQAEYSPQGTLLDRADRYARELILGQTMSGSTMSSGKGGQAFGVVEQDVKGERIDAAGKFVCEIINKQLIPAILELNYGDIEDAPKIRLLEESEGRLGDAQRDQILKSIGMPLGIDYMRKKYSIPEPAEGEEILGAPEESVQQATHEAQLADVGEDGLPENKTAPGSKEARDKSIGKSTDENATDKNLPSTNSEPAQSKAGSGADTRSGHPQDDPFTDVEGHWTTIEGRHVFVKFSNAQGKRFTVHQQEDGSFRVHDNHHNEYVTEQGRYTESRQPATFHSKLDAENAAKHLQSVHQARLNRRAKLGAKHE